MLTLWLVLCALIVLIICAICKMHREHDIIDTFDGSAEEYSFPIDIVYTWAGEQHDTNKRIANNNELQYSLRSVFKYAPWVNHIYIFMNPPQKIPSWFKSNSTDKITVIDHNAVIPSSFLPNTNSNAIETFLVDIPHLSEHFIYFNDDVFLTAPTQPSDYFTSDGKARVSHRLQQFDKNVTTIKRNGTTIAFPPGLGHWYPHCPIAIRKSIAIQFRKQYSEFIHLVRQVKHRNGLGCDLCDVSQLPCPCLQQHYPLAIYMMNHNAAVLCNFDTESSYLNLDSFKQNEHHNVIKHPTKFLCVNDTVDNDQERAYFKQMSNSLYEQLGLTDDL